MFMVQIETRVEDLTKDIFDLKNLYSSPQSSLNRVLDNIIQRIKELEYNPFSKASSHVSELFCVSYLVFDGIGRR